MNSPSIDSARSRTVLLTGVGGPAGKSLARQLQDRGHTVIGTDIKPTDTPVSRFIQGPRADDLALVPFLTRVLSDPVLGIDTFIPTVQDELPAVAVGAPLFDAATVVSNAGAAALCQDKWLTCRALDAYGVAVPTTVAGNEEPLDFPFIAKPRVSRGGRGVTVVTGESELPHPDATLVFQSFATGVEYCPQVYRSPLTGEVTVRVLEKTKLRDGNVGNADAVELAEGDAVADIEALATAAVEKLDLVGAVDMDIRRTAAGQPVILEINARFGANSAHTPEMLTLLLADLEAGAFARPHS
ncbi:ATP-grasp domain-containing protein [Corynebacterium incognita]|uniref:ATP-grasp domain-containing protein n=1 Tax=Corynebacterium incognita TaxID=2754725 RepID=A0A7G7CP91_9CORY|nr:ATP-grasp domain-containing protein [Corynebacterium incognita]QNE89407.1 ATP-grasp domain-containing protein [Corynebacterium incognita]